MAEMQFQIKAMNRDLAMSKFNPEFAYEIYNMRVVATDSQTSFALTNERGTEAINKLYLSTIESIPNYEDLDNQDTIVIEGTVIGASVLNNKLYIFTHDQSMLHNYVLPKDRLYEIYKKKIIITNEGYRTVEIYVCEELFNVQLNLDLNHPLDILPYYESEDIQKLYWVDGKNQARMFNVISRNLTFDFLPEVSTDNIITIEKKAGGGKFPAGVIQYCFTFSVKNGQESNIFYTSPLYYITRNSNYGLPAGEYAECSFQINFDKLTFNNFDYVNVYSLLRTTYNGEVECRKVGSFDADTISTQSLSYEQWNTQRTTSEDTSVVIDESKVQICRSPNVKIIGSTQIEDEKCSDFIDNLNNAWKLALKNYINNIDPSNNTKIITGTDNNPLPIVCAVYADYSGIVYHELVVLEDGTYKINTKIGDNDDLSNKQLSKLIFAPSYTTNYVININTLISEDPSLSEETSYFVTPIKARELWDYQETSNFSKFYKTIADDCIEVDLTNVTLDLDTFNIKKDLKKLRYFVTVTYNLKNNDYTGEYTSVDIIPKYISGHIIDARDSLQETIPVSHLLITCQRQEVIPNTIANKDGTLFLGKLKVHSTTIPQFIKDALQHKDTWEFEPGTAIQINSSIKQEQRSIGTKDVIPFSTKTSFNTRLDNQEQECSRLDLNSRDRKIFKSNEYYRIGIQFSNARMEKSEVVDLGFTKINSLVLSGSQVFSSYPVYQLSNITIENDNGDSVGMIDALQSLGWTSARLMIQETSTYEKSITAQGIVCPTVFNLGQRVQDSPSAMSSWFFRPFGSKATLPHNHLEPLLDNTNYNGEIQSISYTLPKDEAFKSSTGSAQETKTYYKMYVQCRGENFNLHRHKDTCIITGYISKVIQSDTETNETLVGLFDGGRCIQWKHLTKRREHNHSSDTGQISYSKYESYRNATAVNSTIAYYKTFVNSVGVLANNDYNVVFGPFCTIIDAGRYEKNCKQNIAADAASLVSQTLSYFGLEEYKDFATGINVTEWEKVLQKNEDKQFTGSLTFNMTTATLSKAADNSSFFVDTNIIDFYTPEDINLMESTNYSTSNLRILGIAELSKVRSDAKIELETNKHSNLASGVLPIPDNNQFTCAYWGYNDDYLLPTNYVGDNISYSNDVYLIYPWHRQISLGAQKNKGNVTITTDKTKLNLDNPSVEYQNTVFGQAKTKCLFNGRDYNIYQYINCGNYSLNDGEISSSLANNGTIKIKANKFNTEYITYQGSPDFIYVPKTTSTDYSNLFSGSSEQHVCWPWREVSCDNWRTIQKRLHSRGIYCIWSQNKQKYVEYLNDHPNDISIFEKFGVVDSSNYTTGYTFSVTPLSGGDSINISVDDLQSYRLIPANIIVYISKNDPTTLKSGTVSPEVYGALLTGSYDSTKYARDIYPTWLWPYTSDGEKFEPSKYTESSLRSTYMNNNLRIDNITVADPINIKFTTSPHLVCQLGGIVDDKNNIILQTLPIVKTNIDNNDK